MVEGEGGVAELDRILATPHLDGVFLGPMDLSHALGVPGQMAHPRVVETIERIVATCRATGTTTGIFAGTAEAARKWIAGGVTLVGVGVDATHLLRALKETVAAVKD